MQGFANPLDGLVSDGVVSKIQLLQLSEILGLAQVFDASVCDEGKVLSQVDADDAEGCADCPEELQSGIIDVGVLHLEDFDGYDAFVMDCILQFGLIRNVEYFLLRDSVGLHGNPVVLNHENLNTFYPSNC